MKEGTSEYSLMMLFDDSLHPYLPLMTPSKLANPALTLPISIIVGDDDWVKKKIEGAGIECVEMRQEVLGEDSCSYWVCPTSGHNMQLDNPVALSNILIREIIDENLLRILTGSEEKSDKAALFERFLPILKTEEYLKSVDGQS